MRRRTYYCMQLSILLTESMSLIRSIRGHYTSVLRELCKPQEDSGRLSAGTIFSGRDYDQAVSTVRAHPTTKEAEVKRLFAGYISGF